MNSFQQLIDKGVLTRSLLNDQRNKVIGSVCPTKPRLKKVGDEVWLCSTATRFGTGITPSKAFEVAINP